MGFWDVMSGFTKSGTPELPPGSEIMVPGYPRAVKTIEVGASGTEINAGYFNEEYLEDLSGTRWADKIDEMVRSDGGVNMVLRALTLPLLSARWVIRKKDNSLEADVQKRLVERALFENVRGFTRTLAEILTYLRNGYSLFELTHKTVLGDQELGDFTTIDRIGWRSQRTIERWSVAKNGDLMGVEQVIDGDLGRTAFLDAKFLMHFSNEQYGDNYQGTSILRPIYGNWLRKNHFLKLLAAGTEKYAIPVPILTIPSGKESSPEFSKAIEMLKKYTSNQSNYMTVPEGWTLDVKATTFESDKVRNSISAEDRDMANSILAGFILLGQNGAEGSRALGSTLSDFFAQTIRVIVDTTIEGLTRCVIEPQIRLNMPNPKILVELTCDGIEKKADQTYATLLKTLKDGSLLDPDPKIKAMVREKFEMPEIDPLDMPTPVAPTPMTPEINTAPEAVEASEQLSERRLRLADPRATKQRETSAIIRKLESDLHDLYVPFLGAMGVDIVSRMMASDRGLSAVFDADATMTADYEIAIRSTLLGGAHAASRSITDLADRVTLQEVKFASSRDKKLRELQRKMRDASQLLVDAWDRVQTNPSQSNNVTSLRAARRAYAEVAKQHASFLEGSGEVPSKTVSAVRSRAKFIMGVQIADLDKSIGLQFQASFNSTDDDRLLEKDMYSRLMSFLGSPTTTTGPSILASQTVNEARLDASRSSGIEDSVESYTFIAVDDERTSDICIELDGRTFAANDPDLDRYSPPMHHNCRSYLAVNMKSFRGNPSVTEEPLALSKDALGSITLSESSKRRRRMPVSKC